MSDWIHPEWQAPAGVVSLCSTRGSDGRANSLNFALPENRRKLREGMPGAPVWLHQVHSNRVIRVDTDTLPETREADACYCDIRQRVVAILVADCLPILLCSKEGKAIAAIHAGWRGLASGIIGRTLQLARPGEWSAWLGPAIGPCHYEVSDDVQNQFPQSHGFTPAAKPGKWYMDLYAIAAQQLQTAGVHDIHGGSYCTFCDQRCDQDGDQDGNQDGDQKRFFSHRRDGETGRMAAFIWMT